MVKFAICNTDITTLKVECIVNASNESGLGCFRGKDHCIDAAIHEAAGPSLYEECKKLGGIPTGVAKITPGFNLPCKYIIHVTGPRAQFHKEVSHAVVYNFEILANAYTACLNVARANNITEIAFCCISTGLFGYPQQESAQTAIESIIKWLATEKYEFKSIIFDVFTYADHAIYEKILQTNHIEYESQR